MYAFASDYRFPRRFVIVILTSIGMCIIHAQRVNIAVTAVTILDEQAEEKVHPGQARSTLPEVDWSPEKLGFLHSIFFIGYIVTQLPGGYLATKLPSHRLYGTCILFSCGFNLLLPFGIVHGGYAVTCMIRCIQGLSEGFLFPSCYAILWHWTTPSERGKLGALVLAGVYFGAVLGLPLAGAITHYLRWDVVYYFFGVIGIVWTIIWMILSYESPAEHPGISEEEITYINDQQKETNILYQDAPIPWASILTSLPVQAINVCHFARSFVFFLLVTNEPAYLNVFGYGLATNGALSAMPHLGKAVVALSSGPLADYLLSQHRLSTTHIRKLFTCLGYGIESICFLLLYFLDNGTLSIVFLTIGVTASGFAVSGWNINHLDLAPRYASILIAISTAIGTASGIIVPIVVGHMTKEQVIGEWQNVFLLTSGVVAFAVIFYMVFGSGQKQKWADPPPPEVTLLLPKSDPIKRPIYHTVSQTEPAKNQSCYPAEVNAGQLPVAGVQTQPQEGAAVGSLRKESSPKETEEQHRTEDGPAERLSDVTTKQSGEKSDSDEIDITANDSLSKDNEPGEAVIRRQEPKIQ